jgi:hypothetical protein
VKLKVVAEAYAGAACAGVTPMAVKTCISRVDRMTSELKNELKVLRFITYSLF